MKENNSYYNESVDFYIEKPMDWVFFPTEWVLNIRNRTALSNEDITQIMQQANIPFVYMQKPLNREDIAFPTAQATCRYFENPTPEKMKQLARLQIQTFENGFKGFELIEISTNETISRSPANYFKCSFSIKNESGDTFHCLSQSWTVFFNNIGYTIGLSGSSENFDEYKSGMNEIISSILIGQSA